MRAANGRERQYKRLRVRENKGVREEEKDGDQLIWRMRERGKEGRKMDRERE